MTSCIIRIIHNVARAAGRGACWAAVFALPGCALLRDAPAPPVAFSSPAPAVTACLVRFAAADARIAAGDSATYRVPGFPFLRTDRFLASFRDSTEPQVQRAWVTAMAALDASARQREVRREDASPTTQDTDLTGCRTTLVDTVLRDPAAVARLRAAVPVPDVYRTWQRVLGAYPLARVVGRWGSLRLQRRHAVSPQSTNPAATTYDLPAAGAHASPLDWARVARDDLGRPRLSRAARAALLARHAPVWRVGTASPADVIGAPSLHAGRPQLDTTQPTVYTYTAHTRFGDRVLLQLHYVIWFAARPPQGRFDLLAGAFDGLTWRVTLDRDGVPLVYDVMHNCGCYHQWYPTSRLRARAVPATEEPLWIPFVLPAPGPLEAVEIELAPATHYVTAVTTRARDSAGTKLRQRPYGVLHRLHDGPVRRSLFDADGLVAASRRGERFVLWPFGVPSPGAMRDRGHHATAFVGRRHFDEARLIERYFARVVSGAD